MAKTSSNQNVNLENQVMNRTCMDNNRYFFKEELSKKKKR